MIRIPTRRSVRGSALEGALLLLIAPLLAACALVLASRAQDGLDRYRLDRIAGRAAIASESMVEAYCREVTPWVAQAPRSSRCATAVEPGALRDAAAVMDTFAERLSVRYQALDRAFAALAQAGMVDWQLVSEAYATDPVDETLQSRLKESWAELDRARDETLANAPLARRLDRTALRRAVEIERDNYGRAVQRADWTAAGESLLRLAGLLDGKGGKARAVSVATVLDAERNAGRARQAEALVRHGWQLWLGWAGWLWLAVKIGRQPARPLFAFALLLALALLLAGAEQHWLDVRLPTAVYWAGGGLASLAALLDQFAGWRRWAWAQALPHRRAASAWLLPGWLLFVGTGWLLLADLSLHFHPRLRFLLVEHFIGVWGAVLLLALVPLFASQLSGALAWLLGHASAPAPGARLFGVAFLIALPGVAALTRNEFTGLAQYHTGEMFKCVAVFYAAWFLLMRASLISSGGLTGDLPGWFNTFLPAGLALLAIVSSLWITKDLGPILVVVLCLVIWAGAFLGVRLMLAALAGVYGLIFLGGGFVSPVVAERVQSLGDPFSSKTDDLVRLLWFQQEAPLTGFGLGKVPWCGYAGQERCLGLPLQTPSDYTFTALTGIAGVGAWILVALIALWVVALMRSHWDTPVHPCGLLADRHALREGLRAWIAVTFGTVLAVQLAVTVAGNLAWVPLTGITLPFMSFGTTALLTMTTLYALVADKIVSAAGAEHGRW